MVVLVKQPKRDKLSTPINPNPFVVKEKKGTMVTAHNGSKTITRNSSMFKVIPKGLMKFEEAEEEEEIGVTQELAEPVPAANPVQDQIHNAVDVQNLDMWLLFGFLCWIDV